MKTLKFISVGKKHENENDFFKFIVFQEFSMKENRAIQWCKVIGLSIIVESDNEDIISFVEMVVKNGIATNEGHKYILN